MTDPHYACGYSERELERLEIQGAFYEAITGRLLRAAGLAPAMRVLDVGCGVGDVAFLAAEMVGPSGSVVGMDRVAETVAAARARGATRGARTVEFRQGEIDDLTLDRPVDALVGRFVLMHQPDPVHALRAAARHLRPGGVVAFLESHLDGLVAGLHSSPHSPTYDRLVRWLVETIRTAGAHTDMGLRLREVFVEAGLPAPELFMEARVEGGADAAIYRYMAESLRSVLPLAEQFGVVTLEHDAVDELEDTLREEVVAGGGVLVSPMVVGAWCRAD